MSLHWTGNECMTLEMSWFLLTDQNRETLDGPGGWENGLIYISNERYQRLRRQQWVGGVVLCAGDNGDIHVGLAMVPERVKVTAAVCCNPLKVHLDPRLEDMPLWLLKILVLMHDKDISHSARATPAFLGSYGMRGERFNAHQPLRISALSKIFGPTLNKISFFRWTLIYVERYVMVDHQSRSKATCSYKEINSFRG